VEAYSVILTGEGHRTIRFQVASNVTTYTTDNNISRHFDVGNNYTVSICSVNSFGCSDAVNATIGMLTTPDVDIIS